MQDPNHTPPSVGTTAFNCPYSHCGVYARQSWSELLAHSADEAEVKKQTELMVEFEADPMVDSRGVQEAPFVSRRIVRRLFISECEHCKAISIWVNGQIAWPKLGAPQPNSDLPSSVLQDYEEAGLIAADSPRGAAALLRLAVEKLCIKLVPDKNNLNDRIAELFKMGLNQDIQRALDSVRVVGNHAVHPGQIDFKDDRAKVTTLFGLINFVAQVMITNPKKLAELYESLPEDDRKNIKKRDGHHKGEST